MKRFIALGLLTIVSFLFGVSDKDNGDTSLSIESAHADVPGCAGCGGGCDMSGSTSPSSGEGSCAGTACTGGCGCCE